MHIGNFWDDYKDKYLGNVFVSRLGSRYIFIFRQVINPTIVSTYIYKRLLPASFGKKKKNIHIKSNKNGTNTERYSALALSDSPDLVCQKISNRLWGDKNFEFIELVAQVSMCLYTYCILSTNTVKCL